MELRAASKAFVVLRLRFSCGFTATGCRKVTTRDDLLEQMDCTAEAAACLLSSAILQPALMGCMLLLTHGSFDYACKC